AGIAGSVAAVGGRGIGGIGGRVSVGRGANSAEAAAGHDRLSGTGVGVAAVVLETVGRAIGGAGTGRNRAGRWGNRGRIGGFDHGGGWRWRRSLGRSEVRGDLRFVEEDLADAILKTYTDVAFLEIVVEDFVAFERLAEAEPFTAFAFF